MRMTWIAGKNKKLCFNFSFMPEFFRILPINMEILSLFQVGLFRKYNSVVSGVKPLTPKTNSLGISKMWITIFFTFEADIC